MSSNLLSKLNQALKPKEGKNNDALRHSNEVAILDSALKLLARSHTGAELVSYAQDSGLTLHVLRGDSRNFGFFPEKSTGYISCPAGQNMPSVEAIIHLAGVIREATLEETENLKRPHIRLGKERFAAIQGERGREIAITQTLIVHEIHEVTGLTEIVDAFIAMGYGSLLEAHREDLS